MSYLYRDQSWVQIKEHIEKNALIILPVGTTEEHGPHLPVDTDARIAEAYGHGLAQELLPEIPVLLMDSIRYGYSMKIMDQWPGTIIVRSRVLMDMVLDICTSVLNLGFNKMVLLDCHGHHGGALSLVSREVHDLTGKAIAVISPAVMSKDEFNAIRKTPQGGAIHAGEWETSLILHISPEVVDMSRATGVDHMRYNSEFVAGDNFLGKQKVVWSTWYLQDSITGTYGDPRPASAETGRLALEAAVKNGSRFLREFYHFKKAPAPADLQV